MKHLQSSIIFTFSFVLTYFFLLFQVLDASVNRIRILKNNSFTTYTSLKFLYLNDNSITIIETGAFIPLEELEVLDLSLNAIRDLPAMMPSTLRKIYISENPLVCFYAFLH